MSRDDPPAEPVPTPPAKRGSLWDRLTSFRVGKMLARNTVVSCLVFLVGLALLYVLVDMFGMNSIVATGVSFLVANSLHYLLGRSWIFRGTQRPFGEGFVIFLVNAGIGLVVTMTLYAALVTFTPIHYLAARVIVSLVSGLLLFVLNAVFNFRRV